MKRPKLIWVRDGKRFAWTTSDGFGELVIQRSIRKQSRRYYWMRKTFMANPIVLGQAATLAEAKREAQAFSDSLTRG